MNLQSQIESILFVASKPLKISTLAKALSKKKGEVEDVVEQLIQKYSGSSGIYILQVEGSIQMSTNPQNAEAIEGFVKDEIAGELTKAQLETLTVIAYKQPITRPELETIRGVNCSLIIRNLLIRGLIDESDDPDKLTPVYKLSFEAMRHLGVSSVEDLPDYEDISTHTHITQILEDDK